MSDMNPSPATLGAEQDITARQARFVLEYLLDFNATQAAIRAGYSERAASQQGCVLLRNPKIGTRIRKELAAAAERLRQEIDRSILEMANLAYANIGDYFETVEEPADDPEAPPRRVERLRKITTLPRHLAAAIKTVKHTRDGMQLVLHDKLAAIQQLRSMLGIHDNPPPAVPVQIVFGLDPRAPLEDELPEKLVDDGDL